MASQYLSGIFSLEGKTAIFTGATGGLGSALAIAFAQAGASIISIELANDSLSEDLKTKIAGAGGKISQVHCDLRNAKSLRDCYRSIWETGTEPDVLVNCAGVMRRNLCENATDEELDLVSPRILEGLFFAC
jgi:2-dehydro-3-deoxy-D-gluconate 5-dehydrogenase